ncbi:MAG: enoyl-CoA hydratase/isomerase family protein [Colwelliaceae bacterium]|nr:enoyl-CoA hydratase/isomerase family protein [Colwelliaceae bacterium]
MTEPLVLFKEQPLDNDLKAAFATLNSSKSLNALSLPMIDLLLPQLRLWLANNEVAFIVLQGIGDKAFCAGGDVVSIYHDLAKKHQCNANKTLSDSEIEQSLGVDFFTKEYQLDQVIHNATKPILVWADGYVMGGGIGLVAGASHRAATEKTVMAMPEVTIGLYPDVGASWFLNQMPKGVGLFLGLTGMSFNGYDAKNLALIDNIVLSNEIESLNSQLLSIKWSKKEKDNHQLLSDFLDKNEISNQQKINNTLIDINLETIKRVTVFDNIIDIYNAIINEESDDEWFIKAQRKLKHGSPLSAHLIFHQLKLCQDLSLTECFQREFNLSKRCCQFSEFVEGVRALLVDKDNEPVWAYKSIEKVDNEKVKWFFTDFD